MVLLMVVFQNNIERTTFPFSLSLPTLSLYLLVYIAIWSKDPPALFYLQYCNTITPHVLIQFVVLFVHCFFGVLYFVHCNWYLLVLLVHCNWCFFIAFCSLQLVPFWCFLFIAIGAF